MTGGEKNLNVKRTNESPRMTRRLEWRGERGGEKKRGCRRKRWKKGSTWSEGGKRIEKAYLRNFIMNERV